MLMFNSKKRNGPSEVFVTFAELLGKSFRRELHGYIPHAWGSCAGEGGDRGSMGAAAQRGTERIDPHDEHLPEEERKADAAWWEKVLGGINKHGIRILEESESCGVGPLT